MLSRSRSLTSLCSLLVVAACGQATTTVDDDTVADDAPDAAAGDDVAPDADDGGGDDDVPDAALPPPPDAPQTCPDGGVLEGGVCTLLVPCKDTAPAHASSTIVDVAITYTEGLGWSEPAECAWTCDPGRCAVAGQCATDVPDLGYELGDTGSRWFGGDDRDLDGDGVMDIRSVGAGESFVASDPMAITRVGLYFETGFASATTGVAHGAVVTIELRDSSGAVLASASKLVGAAFTGGFVRWDLDATIPAGTYILTAYVPGVFSAQNYTAGIRTDYANGFPGGTAYIKEIQTAGGAMGDWTDWQSDPGVDHAFSIVAACPL